MSHALKDLLDQDQLKILAKRYLTVLKAQDPQSAPSLMQVQSNLAKAVGHNSWHEAQKYWARSAPSLAAQVGLDVLGYSDAQTSKVIEWGAPQELTGMGLSSHHAKQLVMGAQKRVGVTCISGSSHDKRLVMERLLGALAPMHSKWATIGQFDLATSEKTRQYPLDVKPGVVMRLDPSWIAYEEVRDQQASNNISKMALAGFSILTSVLAKDAVAALHRFNDEWGAPCKTPDAFNLFCHVKSYPKLCACAILPYDEHTMQIANDLSQRYAALDWHFANPQGCPQCNHQGKKGLTMCAEIIEWTPELGYALSQHPSEDVLAQKVFGSSSSGGQQQSLGDDLLRKTIAKEICAKDLAGSQMVLR